ncbi:MFS domain-containing protein [Fusarium sp. LHS14.1]|nr:MFS domain-containing protein [Fusarium sp. LHS14.1]
MTATANDTESSRLLPAERDGYGSTSDCESAPQPEEPKPYSHAFIARVVIALLIGVFTSNADGSLVLATHPVIASEFGDLADSSWLFISFMLAGAASQTVYGKLSDIFGRKAILMFCYGLFALGCALVGIGRSMWQVILGRVISGSGGAGMTAMASVIITDLAPLREVASWQSYMNVIATVGRSIGGPLGGLLADTIGWRWSFLGQAPIFAASMVICGLLLPSTSHGTQESSISSRLARIDAVGALLLGATVLSLMMPLEIGGQKIPWNHPIIFALFAASIVLAVAFVLVESRWAKEPIFPLRLLRNAQVTKSYLMVAAQAGAQLAMMYTVPIYFQVTQRVSSTIAGAHLFPAVIGNTIGGIAAGIIINRTGRYKALLVFAAMSSITGYTLMLLRWHGHTSWAESLYVFPGGLGTGIAFSAGFISLQASIDPKDKAAAAAGLFMTTTLGTIVGMAGTSAIIQGYLRYSVQLDLTRLGMSQAEIAEIIRKASESVSYIEHATGAVQKVLIDGYVTGIEYGHGLSIVFAAITLITASLLKERKL